MRIEINVTHNRTSFPPTHWGCLHLWACGDSNNNSASQRSFFEADMRRERADWPLPSVASGRPFGAMNQIGMTERWSEHQKSKNREHINSSDFLFSSWNSGLILIVLGWEQSLGVHGLPCSDGVRVAFVQKNVVQPTELKCLQPEMQSQSSAVKPPISAAHDQNKEIALNRKKKNTLKPLQYLVWFVEIRVEQRGWWPRRLPLGKTSSVLVSFHLGWEFSTWRMHEGEGNTFLNFCTLEVCHLFDRVSDVFYRLWCFLTNMFNIKGLATEN